MTQLLRSAVRRRAASQVALVCAGVLLAVLGLAGFAQAQEVQYVYDDLNRLVGVVDQHGNAAEYVYDAVGNILEIKRFTVDPNATLAISLVSPRQGRVGTSVQLFGKGFSPTPGDNQVAFNGISATVTAASAMRLTTTVPSGATTGPLTVTVGSLTATAPEPFTVLQTFAVSPAELDLALGGSFGFQATLDGAPTSAVTWRVNGIVGGSPSLGTITPAGVYTAPSTPPAVQPLAIEAVLTADPPQVATATLRVSGHAAGLIAASPVTAGRAATGAGQILAGPVSVGRAPSGSVQALSGPVTVVRAPSQPVLAGTNLLTVTGRPIITALAPDGGSPSSTLTLTVSGANLQGATALQALRNSLGDATVTASAVAAASDGTTLTCTLTIGATAPLGARVLQAVTPQGRSTHFDLGANVFTVRSP